MSIFSPPQDHSAMQAIAQTVVASAEQSEDQDQTILPQHVAIVMDGNGRWAKKQGVHRATGHYHGAVRAQEIMLHAQKLGVRYLSLFAFSKENWGRSSDEITELSRLFAERLQINQDNLFFQQNQIRLHIIGDLSDFSAEIQKKITHLMQATAQHNGLCVTIGLSYGAKQDIIRAAQHLARECLDNGLSPEAIDESAFTQALSTHHLPPIDLLIRSSGELRLSNFMLWELAYAELYFTTTLWPDFTPLHFTAAIESFQRRHRRFGKR